MIKLGILSHKDLPTGESYIFAEKKYNRDSYSARALLEEMYRENNSKPLPLIEYTPSGKPYLSGEGEPYISLSHTDNYSFVCLSDTYRCGADIEEKQDREKAERITARYLSKVSFNLHSLQEKCEISFYKFDTGRGISKTVTLPCPLDEKRVEYISSGEKIVLSPSMASSFESGWTLVESALKCSGEGFRAFPGVSELLEKYCTLSMKAEVDEGEKAAELYFSIALDSPII